MEKYDEYIERKKKELGEKFDPSDLSPQFIPHYNSGARIEVKTMGTIKRGRVGVTTGWRPAFLLLLNRRSISSIYVLTDKDKILKRVSA